MVERAGPFVVEVIGTAGPGLKLDGVGRAV
jgi:hypothetical protein